MNAFRGFWRGRCERQKIHTIGEPPYQILKENVKPWYTNHFKAAQIDICETKIGIKWIISLFYKWNKVDINKRRVIRNNSKSISYGWNIIVEVASIHREGKHDQITQVALKQI